MTITYMLTAWDGETKVESYGPDGTGEIGFSSLEEAFAHTAQEQHAVWTPDHIYFRWEQDDQTNLVAHIARYDVNSNDFELLGDRYKIEIVESEEPQSDEQYLIPLNDVVGAIFNSYLPRSRDHIIESIQTQLAGEHPEAAEVIPEVLRNYINLQPDQTQET